jgi:SAM-dependent methyltransferase
MSNFLINKLERYLNVMSFNLHGAFMRHKLRRKVNEINGCWLDIGAGDAPYKSFFEGADQYLTTNTKRHYSSAGFRRLDPVTTYWIEDGTQLPSGNESLDGIALFQVLSVIKNPDLLFREVNRVLKSNGTLFLSTDFLYPVWSEEDTHRLTANRLAELLRENGFVVAEEESFGGFFSMIYMLYIRFLKAYPARWKKRSGLMKMFGGSLYLFSLLTLPLISLFALLIFLAEKNVTDYSEDTYNLWLVAVKQ